jgi:hypothetical protein
MAGKEMPQEAAARGTAQLLPTRALDKGKLRTDSRILRGFFFLYYPYTCKSFFVPVIYVAGFNRSYSFLIWSSNGVLNVI